MPPLRNLTSSRVTTVLGTAAAGNLLGSIGGGRVLSAGQGVTGLTLFGSGSVMALLFGTVLSVGLLRLASLVPVRMRLVCASALSLVCSAGLLTVYRLATAAAAQSAGPGTLPLQGLVAWLFFVTLVLRCALWFAARSLRTGLISARSRSWLGLTEGAYFGGLVLGLIIGLPPWFGGDRVASALVLDIALLTLAVGGDWMLGAALGHAPAQILSPAAGSGSTAWVPRLILSFAAATIGCQIVLFHLADWLARPAGPALRSWADSTLAAFYLGVALTAVSSVRLKPTLALNQQGRANVRWGGLRQVAVSTLCALAGALLIGGMIVMAGLANQDGPVGRGLARIGALIAIACGSAVFELLVLALLNAIAVAGPGTVALAIAVAGSLATLAMLGLLVIEAGVDGWVVVNVVGLSAAAYLARRGLTLQEQQGTAWRDGQDG